MSNGMSSNQFMGIYILLIVHFNHTTATLWKSFILPNTESANIFWVFNPERCVLNELYLVYNKIN